MHFQGGSCQLSGGFHQLGWCAWSGREGAWESGFVDLALRLSAARGFSRNERITPFGRLPLMKTTRFLAGPPEICAHLGIGAQTTGRSGRNLSRRPACLRYGGQSLLLACQGVVSSLLLLVHIHMDDALVPRALALEHIAVALKARVPVEERCDDRVVLGRKLEPEDLAVIGNVAAVAHADDGAGDARASQDVLGRDVGGRYGPYCASSA